MRDSPERREALGPYESPEYFDDDLAAGLETDQNGVEFGTNCLTPGVCRQGNLCLGTCKLF